MFLKLKKKIYFDDILFDDLDLMLLPSLIYTLPPDDLQVLTNVLFSMI